MTDHSTLTCEQQQLITPTRVLELSAGCQAWLFCPLFAIFFLLDSPSEIWGSCTLNLTCLGVILYWRQLWPDVSQGRAGHGGYSFPGWIFPANITIPNWNTQADSGA